MSELANNSDQIAETGGRRKFLGSVGGLTLSATALTLLAGCQSMASNHGSRSSMSEGPSDVQILNSALTAEHEAIAIYQIAAESGLISGTVLRTAVTFQGHHKQHRDAVASTISQLGGTPVGAKSRSEYETSIAGETLRNQNDVLDLAYRLEKAAAEAYIGAIPMFDSDDLSKVAGRVSADEVMHWTIYAHVLGRPLPQQALTFGA